MSVAEVKKLYEVNEIYFDGISELSAKLGPRFAERGARADEGDRFVAENFVELKAHGLVAAGVPKELGGGGASHGDLAAMLRQLGHYCGSTRWLFPPAIYSCEDEEAKRTVGGNHKEKCPVS